MGKKTTKQVNTQTSNALFTCSGQVNGECQKLLQFKTRLRWSILLVIDIISIIAYIIVTSSLNMKVDAVIIVCMSVVFVACIAMYIVLYDQIKKANKLGVVNYYDFHERTIKAKSVKGDQVKGTANHFYSEFILVKRIKDYIFISPTKSSSYPIYVKDMSKEEYKILMNFIDKMVNAKRKNI